MSGLPRRHSSISHEGGDEDPAIIAAREALKVIIHLLIPPPLAGTLKSC